MSTVTDGLTTFAYTSGMKVLVIGGAGYIGSHAARILRRHGHDVIIYDNLSTGHEFLAKGFELVVGDIADQDKLGPYSRAYLGDPIEWCTLF